MEVAQVGSALTRRPIVNGTISGAGSLNWMGDYCCTTWKTG
jgi:hypothetical protein